MYEAFYKLREKPFELLPDPDYLFMSRVHTNAYDHFAYAVREGKGFVIISGEIGSGKTALLRYVLRRIPHNIKTAVISNTSVLANQFLKVICRDLELDV